MEQISLKCGISLCITLTFPYERIVTVPGGVWHFCIKEWYVPILYDHLFIYVICPVGKKRCITKMTSIVKRCGMPPLIVHVIVASDWNAQLEGCGQSAGSEGSNSVVDIKVDIAMVDIVSILMKHNRS